MREGSILALIALSLIKIVYIILKMSDISIHLIESHVEMTLYIIKMGIEIVHN